MEVNVIPMYKLAVLVPLCLIAPGIQVKTASNYKDWRRPFLELLLAYETDIIPFKCTEVSYGGLSHGLTRKSHGIDYYSSLDDYQTHCKQLAIKTEEIVSTLTISGYRFAAILGIENSPSCAVNYIYSSRGTLKRPGIFIELLKKQVVCSSLPYVGINKRFPRKSLEYLQTCLDICRERLGEESTNDNYI